MKRKNAPPRSKRLLDAVVKLVKLLDTPDEMKLFAPSVIREIIYRLLKGAQGQRLSHLVAAEGDSRRISKVVKQLGEFKTAFGVLFRQFALNLSPGYFVFSIRKLAPPRCEKSSG